MCCCVIAVRSVVAALLGVVSGLLLRTLLALDGLRALRGCLGRLVGRRPQRGDLVGQHAVAGVELALAVGGGVGSGGRFFGDGFQLVWVTGVTERGQLGA